MQKIPTIFTRDWEGNPQLITPNRNPECNWVFEGEGTATRKWDGTCCLYLGGRLFKRYELRLGKTPPSSYFPAQAVDEATGKQPGWVAVGDGPEDAAYREAFLALCRITALLGIAAPEGTYELVGPKVQGNPDGFETHTLAKHGGKPLPDAPHDIDDLYIYLMNNAIEGIVWHHPDGRMAKLKRRDLGLPWPVAKP